MATAQLMNVDDLAVRAKDDEKAFDQLLGHLGRHFPLIITRRNVGFDREEALQRLRILFHKAVMNYDPTKGSFISYAMYRVLPHELGRAWTKETNRAQSEMPYEDVQWADGAPSVTPIAELTDELAYVEMLAQLNLTPDEDLVLKMLLDSATPREIMDTLDVTPNGWYSVRDSLRGKVWNHLSNQGCLNGPTLERLKAISKC